MSPVTGGDMLKSLVLLPDHASIETRRRQLQLEKELDEALDTGEAVECAFSDHTYYQSLTIDNSACIENVWRLRCWEGKKDFAC